MKAKELLLAPSDAQLLVRVSPELKELFKQFCQERGMTVSGAIRVYMHEVVSSAKKK